MSRKLAAAVCCWSCLATICLTSSARAEVSVEACSDAYTKGQEERLAGRLFSSRSQFEICADPSCPKAIVSDCARWIGEVEADLPSLRVQAKSTTTEPIAELKLLLDGQPVPAEKLNGPLVTEPGPHTLRFEAAGFETVQVQVSLRPEDHEMPVQVSLRPVPAPVPVAEAKPDAPSAAGPSRRHVAAIAAAGAGALALGASLYFGIRAKNQYDDLRDRCGHRCSDASADSVHSKALVADVALATSVLAFGAAAWLYLGASADKPATVALGFEPRLDGARARLRLDF